MECTLKIMLLLFSLLFFLQSEVWHLEGSIEPTGESNFSPYLIPDTGVLTSHLGLVRQLASSTRFILIIPQVGKSICFPSHSLYLPLPIRYYSSVFPLRPYGAKLTQYCDKSAQQILWEWVKKMLFLDNLANFQPKLMILAQEPLQFCQIW